MGSGDSTCFVCDTGRLILTSTLLDVPHFGEVSISVFSCTSCGYRSTDVLPVRARPPSRYQCTIKGPDSLSIRVIRSHTGIVRIPEVGIRIDPGVAAEGFITNVEGILNRVEGIIDHVLRDAYNHAGTEGGSDEMERISRCLELKDRIGSAASGRTSLTLIVEDPSGNSAIVGEDPTVTMTCLGESEVRAMVSGDEGA